jgi:hypothetical protein
MTICFLSQACFFVAHAMAYSSCPRALTDEISHDYLTPYFRKKFS